MMISGDFQAMALVLGKFKEMIIHKAFFLLGSKSPPNQKAFLLSLSVSKSTQYLLHLTERAASFRSPVHCLVFQQHGRLSSVDGWASIPFCLAPGS